jgi:hypothetical protein
VRLGCCFACKNCCPRDGGRLSDESLAGNRQQQTGHEESWGTAQVAEHGSPASSCTRCGLR